MKLPLDDTTIRGNADVNTEIEFALLCDISWYLNPSAEGPYVGIVPEAERILRLFIKEEHRWPACANEIRERYPDWFENAGLRVVR